MPPTSLSELLRLPGEQRAELALALWESLSDQEREQKLSLTPEQAAELDRRWAEHLADPKSALAWDEVRDRLHGAG